MSKYIILTNDIYHNNLNNELSEENTLNCTNAD